LPNISAAGDLGEMLVGGEGIGGGRPVPESARDARDLEMHVRIGVEGNLGDDVGVEIRGGLLAGGGVELRAAERGKRAGKSDRRSAARTADIRVGILERNADGRLVARVIDKAEARLAGPRQTDYVVHIGGLRVEEVPGQR
jgi:hypothetical protein